WFPMLIILAIWRYVYKKLPLSYDPSYWGLVFPLGMYTACTFRLADVLHESFLYVIPRVFFVIAVTAWAITFTGLLRWLYRSLVPPRSVAPEMTEASVIALGPMPGEKPNGDGGQVSDLAASDQATPPD